MTTGNPLTPDQLARVKAALDAWFDPGPGTRRGPSLTWGQAELESMHAALARTRPGHWMSTDQERLPRPPAGKPKPSAL